MQSPSRLARSWRALLPALGVLVGCATPTGTPAPRLPSAPVAYKAASTGLNASTAVVPSPPQGAWWRVFDDQVLDNLIQRAGQGNTDVATKAARVAHAQAALRTALAARVPQIGAMASTGRQGGPLATATGTQGTLVTAGVQLSYEVDLSKRLAASQDAAAWDAQARVSQLASARLMLQAQVAHTYFALRATDVERALARRTLQAWGQTVQISEARARQGSVAELAVLRLRTEMQRAAADAAGLDRRRAELENALALLLGEVASNFAVTENPAWSPSVPEIPSGIPSDVLVRRPDVAEAAQMLQAAQARAASAKVAWLPSLLLTASGGQASPALVDLLRASMRTFGVGALLAAPLFDGGRREAAVAQAQADEDAAWASNRERVLTAFKEVEDQLVALRVLAAQCDHHAAAAAHAARAAAISDSRWRSGAASHLELLDSQRSEWNSQIAWLQARSARAQATVGLIRALGGGWGDDIQHLDGSAHRAGS